MSKTQTNSKMTSVTSTCMYVPLLESLHLKCLKPSPQAGGFAMIMIGCRLSRERILTFASSTENFNSIFSRSKYGKYKICIIEFHFHSWFHFAYSSKEPSGLFCSLHHWSSYDDAHDLTARSIFSDLHLGMIIALKVRSRLLVINMNDSKRIRSWIFRW